MAKRKLTMKHTPKPNTKSDGGWWWYIGIMAIIIVAFAIACYFFGLKETMVGVAIILLLCGLFTHIIDGFKIKIR